MVVDIGGTTEVAVISMGGIVVSQSIRTAGDSTRPSSSTSAMPTPSIGERTAEDIKIGGRLGGTAR